MPASSILRDIQPIFLCSTNIFKIINYKKQLFEKLLISTNGSMYNDYTKNIFVLSQQIKY